jgi:hypothetical protein
MLQTSSQLVHLRLSFPLTSEDFISMAIPPYRTSLIALNYLRALRITCHSRDVPTELIHIIAHLHLPSLSALHLLDPGHSRKAFSRLPDFVKAFTSPRVSHGTAMPVLSVQAEDGWFDHRSTLMLVKALPRVQKLVIDGPRVTDAFMADVARIRSGRPRKLTDKIPHSTADGRSLDALSKAVMSAGSVARRRRVSEDRSIYASIRRRPVR